MPQADHCGVLQVDRLIAITVSLLLKEFASLSKVPLGTSFLGNGEQPPFFTASASIAIETFVLELKRALPLSSDVLLIALILMDNSEIHVDCFSVHRLLLTGTLLAAKMHSDIRPVRISHWAAVAKGIGVDAAELISLERRMLLALQYELPHAGVLTWSHYAKHLLTGACARGLIGPGTIELGPKIPRIPRCGSEQSLATVSLSEMSTDSSEEYGGVRRGQRRGHTLCVNQPLPRKHHTPDMKPVSKGGNNIMKSEFDLGVALHRTSSAPDFQKYLSQAAKFKLTGKGKLMGSWSQNNLYAMDSIDEAPDEPALHQASLSPMMPPTTPCMLLQKHSNLDDAALDADDFNANWSSSDESDEEICPTGGGKCASLPPPLSPKFSPNIKLHILPAIGPGGGSPQGWYGGVTAEWTPPSSPRLRGAMSPVLVASR